MKQFVCFRLRSLCGTAVADDIDGPCARALVFWFADGAHRRGVPIGGENALSGGLCSEHGWGCVRSALDRSDCDELAVLRLHGMVSSPVARRHVRSITASWSAP